MTASRPLRFCHITTFYPPFSFGGDGIWVRRLANSLARDGHEVDVIHCLDSYNALRSASVTPQPTYNHPGVKVHGIKTRWGLLSPLASQQTGGTWPKTKQILDVFNSKQFDVIHYHNVSLLGPGVLELSPEYRAFVKLYTPHEYWLVCPMHLLWKNNAQQCNKPDCLRCTLTFRRPPQWWRYSHMLERCAESVDTFLAPSRFARDLHLKRGFKRQMEHLPFFAPPPVGRTNAPSPASRPYFLYVGRLEKLKGLQDVITVFRDYRGADLLIAGAGLHECELRQLAKGCDHIHFLGWIDEKRLPSLYMHAIAVIIPSVCFEIFPLTALEAFACRTPVIARAGGALPEIIEDSEAGLTFSTASELIEAMEKLRQDDGFQRQLGQSGYSRCSTIWSERTHLDRYLTLIAESALTKFGNIPWLSGSSASSERLRCG